MITLLWILTVVDWFHTISERMVNDLPITTLADDSSIRDLETINRNVRVAWLTR